MEIEAEDGSNILMINYGSNTDFGRVLGLPLFDRTVSRKHISFALAENENRYFQHSESSVNFQVTGKNPVWVFCSENNDVRIIRNKEKGKMSSGDCFCVSARNPIFFRLKNSRVEEEEEEVEEKKGLKETERKEIVLEGKDMVERIQTSDEQVLLGFVGSIDVSSIDHAKEFGFVVMGCEFDNYPKGSIRDIKDWDWFLEEPKDNDSENDEVNERNGTGRKKNVKRKKKDEGDVDQDWVGESDNEKVLIAKQRKGKRPKYATRSKDLKEPIEDYRCRKKLMQKEVIRDNEGAKEDYGDDEDEETLGGFIANNEVLEEEPVDAVEEEEEDYEEDEDADSDDEQISEDEIED